MRILGLDTSGKTASVAIMDTEKQVLLGEHTVYTNRTHSQVIMPMCKNLLNDCNLTLKEIDCLAVAVGPGSYTGLRIGIAAVQGMAMVNNTPCVGVSTLEALAARYDTFAYTLAIMHARADLFYYEIYRHSHSRCESQISDLLSIDQLASTEEIAERLSHYHDDEIVLVGDGVNEFLTQYYHNCDVKHIKFQHAPYNLRLQQSAAGVCQCASRRRLLGTAADLTASYLQAVQIQKKKTDK